MIPYKETEMEHHQTAEKTDTPTRIEEAETYYSMGLFDEALGILDKALSSIG